MKIHIQRGYEGPERRAIVLSGVAHEIVDSDDGSAPCVCTVEFSHWRDRPHTPWPKWAVSLGEPFKRRAWRTSCEAQCPIFVKPQRVKAWPSSIYVAGASVPPFALVRHVQAFTREWRYYVANGVVVGAAQYDQGDEDEAPPALQGQMPDGWCGTVDMGRLADGRLMLVETHEPWAIGLYGPMTPQSARAYADFIIAGWRWLKATP